ncbi:phosphonopyruvate decarboxylase [Sneathiella marina]|uniref:Phosphonopyruvate decarboxylase n=1 Tax=Sneathiella marina TaxID=2950108 RepID=A0ABY4W4N1_9PROT|nr:phosphonopyruvate decarboxylase [Sneathiella marina]USG61998.1 phosphonopyruvate decarboxylase [Sneathiella marina]
MTRPNVFFGTLKDTDIDFFTGVPDSLLKSFCAYVTDNTTEKNHVIASNEGAAVGLAIGYHLSTGKIPLVYFQNSGLGNAINPLMSLADSDVYSIPMLLLIGWRGEPGVPDEPQHVKQGRVLLEKLDAMEIPYWVLSGEEEDDLQSLQSAVLSARENNFPVALVAKKGSFAPYLQPEKEASSLPLSREEGIQRIIDCTSTDDIIVATTGMASRELFEYRAHCDQGHQRDFLTVGGMGHTSQIALGISMQKPDRRVICLDGDGAALMHLGSMAIIGSSKCHNFKHIILNNGAHDSVGGQPTVGFTVSLSEIAKSCGYIRSDVVDNAEDLEQSLKEFLSSDGPALLEVKIKTGNRKDLGRPTISPTQNKENFMRFIQSS